MSISPGAVYPIVTPAGTGDARGCAEDLIGASWMLEAGERGERTLANAVATLAQLMADGTDSRTQQACRFNHQPTRTTSATSRPRRIASGTDSISRQTQVAQVAGDALSPAVADPNAGKRGPLLLDHIRRIRSRRNQQDAGKRSK